MKKLIWPLWIIVTLGLLGYFAYQLWGSEEQSEFLIGDSTHGHYQIELSCDSCHTEAFGGQEVLQDACTNCHAQELKDAHDSHPKKKFNDPREAYRLEILDARYCVTCHTEHQEEQTHAMGVTIPEDYCYHCHKEVGDERLSHKDLAFDSCASAGCHNYHDNRALYERFLVENANQPWISEIAQIGQRNHAHYVAPKSNKGTSSAITPKAYPASHPEWASTSHGQAGVTCEGCHSEKVDDQWQWVESPNVEQCQTCHKSETEGFLAGKHGMRLASDNIAFAKGITPQESSLEFKTSALNKEHGCTACHGAHDFNPQFAATEACLTCHNDEHSQSFLSSPHAKISSAPEESLSCATCHMPRIKSPNDGMVIVNKENTGVNNNGEEKRASILTVEHNQNLMLRPNEKMIRPVCMSCHSLEFSIDSLADEALIKNNFNGKPTEHIPSIDWALEREKR